MTERQPRLVLIDGHALAYRTYFGMPDTFSTQEGEKTNAVYGFMNMILAVWKEYEPDYFIVTFDKGDTFRHTMYAEYKGTRDHQGVSYELVELSFDVPESPLGALQDRRKHHTDSGSSFISGINA